jgi:hypothetical protein
MTKARAFSPLLVAILFCVSQAQGQTQSPAKPASESGEPSATPQTRAKTEQHPSRETHSAPKQTAPAVQQSVRSPSDEEIETNRKLADYTGQLVWVTELLVLVTILGPLFLFGIAFWQARLSRDASERQLRAYAVIETGQMSNVANPPQPAPGQGPIQPTTANITNPTIGPIASLITRNAGQTPALDVRVWANICLREFPLAFDLPPRPAHQYQATSVIGPHIGTNQNRVLPLPLTAQDIAHLNAGTAAIYVYGDILYKDVFGKTHVTRYRAMHHSTAGIIGISTMLTFCDEGNEAD